MDGFLAPPDYASDALCAEQFRNLILSRGAVMLRNAVDPNLLDHIDRKINKLFDQHSTVSATEVEQHIASNDPSEQQFWAHLRNGQIYENTFAPFAGLSYFDIIQRNGLWDLISRAFPESEIVKSPVSNCRRMAASESGRLFDRPLEFHVDAQYHFVDQLSINFWTPLMSCGKKAPGLKVVLLGAQETKDYLEFSLAGYEKKPSDIAYMDRFRCEKERIEDLLSYDLVEYIWIPEFNKGDILVFTSLTMHATHYLPEMTEPRSSVEVRVNLPFIPL